MARDPLPARSTGGSGGSERRRVSKGRFVMKVRTVDDVMTVAVVSVRPDASHRSVVDLLIGRRFSAVPVVGDGLRVPGVVSEADLLRKIEYAGNEEPRLFEGHRGREQRSKARAGVAADP